MGTKREYIFNSDRLGFGNWLTADIEQMSEINADEKVMEFFPGLISKEKTVEFINRMRKQFEKNAFCYFAVDLLQRDEFIGFIGLSEQTYEAAFTPCVDIGWRLNRSHWNNGYAIEGAKRCLEYAFDIIKLKQVYSVAPKVNTRSEQIMKKIGMTKVYEFEHSLLKNHEKLKNCVLYEKINKN